MVGVRPGSAGRSNTRRPATPQQSPGGSSPGTGASPTGPLGIAVAVYFGHEIGSRRAAEHGDTLELCYLVRHQGTDERNPRPQVRDASVLSPNLWSYIDVYDLADAIAIVVESYLPGREVFCIASPDNVGGRPLKEIPRKYYCDEIEPEEPLPGGSASGISIAKARKMFGYSPKRSWRDYLENAAGSSPGTAKVASSVRRSS